VSPRLFFIAFTFTKVFGGRWSASDPARGDHSAPRPFHERYVTIPSDSQYDVGTETWTKWTRVLRPWSRDHNTVMNRIHAAAYFGQKHKSMSLTATVGLTLLTSAVCYIYNAHIASSRRRHCGTKIIIIIIIRQFVRRHNMSVKSLQWSSSYDNAALFWSYE